MLDVVEKWTVLLQPTSLAVLKKIHQNTPDLLTTFSAIVCVFLHSSSEHKVIYRLI
jgi:hypothetical protein